MVDTVHLTSLFEYATEGIILTQGRGPIILVNPAAERMFGYEAKELIGKNIEIVIPSRYQSHHEQLRNNFAAHPQNRRMGVGRDLFGKQKDGKEFPVEVSLSFYYKEEELFVIAFIVDITQRKTIELEMLEQQKTLANMATSLQELNADLEKKVQERTTVLQDALKKLEQSRIELNEALTKEKELNEVKSRFISIASHEFRTPLSTVLSSAALVSKYVTTDDQAKREKHLDKIKNSVRGLNGILEDFLSLGKLEENKISTTPVPFNLEEFMFALVEEMNSIVKKGQKILVRQHGVNDITADKRLLKNILLNLLTNASKFSDEGAAIEIDVSAMDGTLTIVVRDHGIGIPEDEFDDLFSSFHRARNAINIQGTGLGLHIVKRYLELLGGTISFESRLNEGTVFTINIPYFS